MSRPLSLFLYLSLFQCSLSLSLSNLSLSLSLFPFLSFNTLSLCSPFSLSFNTLSLCSLSLSLSILSLFQYSLSLFQCSRSLSFFLSLPLSLTPLLPKHCVCLHSLSSLINHTLSILSSPYHLLDPPSLTHRSDFRPQPGNKHRSSKL